VLAVVLLASVSLIADDAATESDSTARAAASDGSGKAVKAAARADADTAAADKAGAKRQPAAVARLTKPWSQLSSLSDDQKTQIRQIHRKSVDEVKAIEARERDDIMALLSDEQRAELKGFEEKAAAGRKAKAAQQKAEKSAASAPKDATGEAGPATEEADNGN
jgi:Spy/CpxP family protein refolding chaperone